MNLLDRAIAYIAPETAAKRARARFAFEQISNFRREASQRFGYDAARSSRRHGGWFAPATDANAETGPSIAALRNTARELARNNPFARRAIAELVGAQIGTGIMPRADTGNETLNRQINEAWKRWVEDCDPSGEVDFYGIQNIVARAVPESGEVLVRYRTRRLQDGLRIPLQLQVLEADFLDTNKSETPADVQAGRRIINGIEFDEIDRRLAYWLFDSHPGASKTFYARGGPMSKRIPRLDSKGMLNVAHLYLKERPGQVRGASWFATTADTLRDLDSFDEAVWMRKRMEACIGLIVTSPEGDGVKLGADDSTFGAEELAPGMVFKGREGQTIEAFDPKAGPGEDGYRKSAMQRVSAGLGPMREQLTGDFADLTYSAYRGGQISFNNIVEVYRWVCFIPQFLRPTYRRFIDTAFLAGEISEINYGVRWTAPKARTVDPVKDAEAAKVRVRCGFDSWDEVVAEHGNDPDEQLDLIVARNKKIDSAGVILDCDPRKATDNGSKPDKGATDGSTTA